MERMTPIERLCTRYYARSVELPQRFDNNETSFFRYHFEYASFRHSSLGRREYRDTLARIFAEAMETGRVAERYDWSRRLRLSADEILLLEFKLRHSEERLFDKLKPLLDSYAGPKIARARVLFDKAAGLRGRGLWIDQPKHPLANCEQKLLLAARSYSVSIPGLNLSPMDA